MSDRDRTAARLRWARLKFNIVGRLLLEPPEHGELREHLAELSGKSWPHPTTGKAVRFSLSTLERWFYQVKDADDPISVLARKVPKHAGTHRTVTEPMKLALELLYRQHPSWTFKLHYDNLLALAERDPQLGALPSQSACAIRTSFHSVVVYAVAWLSILLRAMSCSLASTTFWTRLAILRS